MTERDFSAFYAAAFPRIQRAVRAYCGDADLAHEATQESFARCYARWRKLKGEPWLDGWVTTTAINLTKKHFSRKERPVSGPVSISPGPTGDRLDLLAGLRCLPERQRHAVVLHYLLDLPVAQVAELMNISAGAVKSHLHKARAALQLSLEASHG